MVIRIRLQVNKTSTYLFNVWSIKESKDMYIMTEYNLIKNIGGPCKSKYESIAIISRHIVKITI